MKKKYPENIDDIGTFYKNEFQNHESEIPEGLWDSIAGELDKLPLPNASSSASTASVATKNIISSSSVIKITTGIVVVSGIIALYIQNNNTLTDFNKKRSQLPTQPLIDSSKASTSSSGHTTDTLIENITSSSINDQETAPIIKLKTGQETHSSSAEENTVEIGSTEPLIENGNTVKPEEPINGPEKQEEPAILKSTDENSNLDETVKDIKPKEPKKKNFFQKKLNGQNDSAGVIFKPKK